MHFLKSSFVLSSGKLHGLLIIALGFKMRAMRQRVREEEKGTGKMAVQTCP